MILDTDIKIKGNSKNIKYYSDLGYDISVGVEIYIKLVDLSKGSTFLVECKCDNCETVKKIPWGTLYKYINGNINNKYYCSKCNTIKRKETNNLKYGGNSPTCNSEIINKIQKTNLEKWGSTCTLHSTDISKKVKETFDIKYGGHPSKNKNIKDKIRKTNLERHGFESYSQTNEFKKRVSKTNIERYGVVNVFQSELIKEEIKKTNLEKYNFEFISQVEEFKIKIKQTNLERYGVENIFQSEEIISNNRNKSKIVNDENYIKYLGNYISLFKCIKGHEFEINSDNYNTRYKSNIPLCTICNPIGDSKSIKEKELFEFIKQNYSGKIIQSHRDVLEIDVYLPDLDLGFEFNGLYWHSEKYKEKSYHLDKTNYFMEKGIRIIHIWEDDWTFRRKILESQVKNLLGKSNVRLFARKCYVKELKTVSEFLNVNHIQGIDRSKHKIGLFHDIELVSVMTFNCLEGRYKMSEGEYNLSRFCNKLGYSVIGGASKMLKWFIKEYDVSRVISYADKDWSVGGLYYTLGFTKMLETKPDYKYVINSERKHKQNFKKKNIGIQGQSITEGQYMKNLGHHKIYDCGKIKFEKIIINNAFP